MKRLARRPFAVAAALLASATAASAVTVDFEAIADGVYVAGTVFSGAGVIGGSEGITFDQSIQVGPTDVVPLSGINGPGIDGQAARQIAGQFGQIKGESIGGSFTSTVSAFSLFAGDSGGDNDIIVLTGFDTFGAIVDTDSFSAIQSQFLSISGAGISSFTLDISAGVTGLLGGSSGFDNLNFTFEGAPVPLPASLPLLGLAIAGMGFVSRRKNRG